MKRFFSNIFFLALFCSVCCSTQVAQATTYADLVITKTRNALTEHSAALGALLPADFTTSVFDDAGNPLMDRLFIFMTMPAGMADLTIQNTTPRAYIDASNDVTFGYETFTLSAGGDVLFSFVNDGTQYVLDRLPFDPTTRAFDKMTIADGTAEKVYVAGSTSKPVSAELPEEIKIIAPTYLNSVKPALNDMICPMIHSAISSMGLDDFSFNPNTEGFFSFTGGTNSKLDLFTDNLSIQTKGKSTDFLGTLVGGMLISIDLSSIEGPTDDNYTTYTDAQLTAMTEAEVQALSCNDLRAMTAAQVALVATKLTESQVSCLSPGQVLELLGFSDISDVFTADQDALGLQLYMLFGSAEKATAAGNVLSGVPQKIYDILAPLSSNPMALISIDAGDLMSTVSAIFSAMVEGAASPFAFMSNSNWTDARAFEIRMHNKGTSTITGGAVGDFKNVGEEMGYLANMMLSGNTALSSMVNDLAIMFQAMVRFTSAPLAVRPSAQVVDIGDVDSYNYTCTRFIFDDIWTDGTTHTNGLLQLPVVGDELDAPSIDIGNPNGQVIFNSGHYKFHTPVSNKKKNMFYVATMAICYREFSVNMPLVNKNIVYTGIGTSVGWGPSQNRTDSYRNVIINDGTFTTYSAEAWKDISRGDNAVDAVGNGWYQHYTDLRLPYNTSILGGTFPDDTYVYRCDAAAEQGVAPLYIYQPDDLTEPKYTSLCERKLVPAATLSEAFVVGQTTPITVDADKESQLLFTVNGTSTKWNYGHESMVADATGNLYLYVPGDCKIDYTYVRNYVTALAPFGERHSGTTMLSMGGDVEVKNLYQDNENFPMKNAYLLYTQLGYYTYIYAGVNLGGLFRTLQEEFQIDRAQHHNFKNTGSSTNESGQNIMTTTDRTGVVFSEVTNNDEYTIEYGIYMMLPVMSDTWTLFSPPFDVANVYVLQTTKEQPGKFNTDSWGDAEYEAFFQRQGAADGDMAQTLVTSVLPDIFSGKGSGIKQPMTYILNSLTNSETTLTRLSHYDGTFASLYTANYYLNEQVPDKEGTNFWKQEDTELLYGEKWQPAPQQSAPSFLTKTINDPDCDFFDDDCGQITKTFPYVDQDDNEQAQQYCIMQRDKVYAMYFPGGANRWYDYKYLIIEGYGPQKLSGKDTHADFYSPTKLPDAEYIALQGNTTFGNATITGASSSHPLFYSKKTEGSFDSSRQDMGTKPVYSFEANTSSSQRVLPSSVYMVSSTNASTKASMPLLHNTLNTLTDLHEEGTLPPLIARSLDAWADQGIMLRAYEQQYISIYSVDGHLIWQGTLQPMQQQHIPAPAGLYLIQGQETTVKLIVN